VWKREVKLNLRNQSNQSEYTCRERKYPVGSSYPTHPDLNPK
jgi:hypothetical protein